MHLKCRLIRHIKENAAVREKSFSFAGCTTGSSRDWGSAAAAGTGVFSKMNDLRATFTALILSFSKPQTGYLCKGWSTMKNPSVFQMIITLARHCHTTVPSSFILYSGETPPPTPTLVYSLESSYFHPG